MSILNKTNSSYLAGITCLLLMSGCATLSKDECKQGDWYSIGISDGERGYRIARIKDHSDACSEHQITPDHAAYESGRMRGLESYCTARNGYSVGAAGNTYRDVCSAQNEPDFLDGYDVGTELHHLKSERRKLEQSIVELEEELETKGKKLSPEQRRQIHDDIKALSRDLGSLDGPIYNLEREGERF